MLILVKMQASACKFTKINTLQWVLFTFIKLYKWYQIAQRITFIDDSYLQSATKELCKQNIDAAVNLSELLEFTVHVKKSILEPTQQLESLVFLIDFTTMIVKIDPVSTRIILKKIKDFLDDSKQTIRNLAYVTGTLVFLFPQSHIANYITKILKRKNNFFKVKKEKF